MDELSNVQLRQELKEFGFTDVGPINASTRGAYLKKLEKLQSGNSSPDKRRKAAGSGHSDDHEAAAASKSARGAVPQNSDKSPKMTRPARKSTRISHKSQKFTGNNSEDEADEELTNARLSNVRKKSPSIVHSPAPKPPPTAHIMSGQEIGTKNQGGQGKVPGQANLNKSFDQISTKKSVANTATTENFPLDHDGSRSGKKFGRGFAWASFGSPLSNFTGRVRQPIKRPEQPAVYADPAREQPQSRWLGANALNSGATENIVDSFRSKLSDENLWLNKFSLDSNLATRRRMQSNEASVPCNPSLAFQSKKLSNADHAPDFPIKIRPNYWHESAKVVKNYVGAFATNCSSYVNRFKGDLFKAESKKMANFNRHDIAPKPTVDLQKFRQMNARYNGTAVSTRTNLGATHRKNSQSWLHFDHESSRHILFALLSFLMLITAAYFCTVYRENVKKGAESVYGAGMDTIEFVYKNMILPVLVVILFVGTVYGVFAYKRYKWHQVAEEQRKIFEMVGEIIAILKKHHEDCLADGNRQPYLAVPHVRDMLILPQRRAELYPIWEKAVEYLNENESRIRTENQCISGEEFMVWRWLQAAHASANHRGEDKLWQGHAFPEEEIQNNAPRYAYYECLKLRGLFDPEIEMDNDWPEHVQDAILEKLGNKIRVLHLALDTQSKDGCVFMKLATKAEAGEAFKILNGSWFNGRLVSVKYLRPERYHERFPDSLKAYIPLSVKKIRNSVTPLF